MEPGSKALRDPRLARYSSQTKGPKDCEVIHLCKRHDSLAGEQELLVGVIASLESSLDESLDGNSARSSHVDIRIMGKFSSFDE